MFRFVKKLFFNRLVVVAVLTAGIVSYLFITDIFNPKPDLKVLFQQSNQSTDQPPVIFIHGVLGSKLRDKQSGEEVWFSSPFKLLFDEFRHLALDINPTSLEVEENRYESFELAGDIIGKDFYGNIIKTLHDYGGYQLATPGQMNDPTAKNYYVFHYDWRQDNLVSVRKLADLIDQIRIDYANPDLKVDIVAHSMGGLIARYYIRYGRDDVMNSNDFPVNMYGGERIRRVILLGTPNLGTVEMLSAFIDGIKLGFKRIETETLITMPSLYQLLPHPIYDWIITVEGKPLKRDLFDAEIWRRFQWSIFDPEVRARIKSHFKNEVAANEHMQTLELFFAKTLERARRFVWSLTVPLPEKHPLLIVFGGDCHLTPARILVEDIDGDSLIRTYPDQISHPVAGIDYERLLMLPGDGSVTKASLLGRNALDPSIPRHPYIFFPIDFVTLLCEEHNSLTGNINFQDNLLNSLLFRD